jgi:hypothetical protein
VTKLVSKDEKQTYLFKLVSLITGWKNSLKGEWVSEWGGVPPRGGIMMTAVMNHGILRHLPRCGMHS